MFGPIAGATPKTKAGHDNVQRCLYVLGSAQFERKGADDPMTMSQIENRSWSRPSKTHRVIPSINRNAKVKTQEKSKTPKKKRERKSERASAGFAAASDGNDEL